MKLLDPAHPFFAPAWRRVAIVAVCLGWALVELVTGAVFWAILFGAAGAWCLYVFFLAPDATGRQDHDQNKDQP